MKPWQPEFELIFNQEVTSPEIGNRYLNPAGVFRYRTKTIKSGEMLESEVYPIWNTRAETRRARGLVTRESQRRLNERNSVRKMVRLVNTNFTADDFAVTLTYANAPESYKQAQRDIRNYIRRVKDWRKKNGLPELKYIYTIEGDEKAEAIERQALLPGMVQIQAGQQADHGSRMHLHVILSGGMDRAVLERIWGKGRANCRRLQPDEYGLEALSRYMVKERRTPRRWYGSRNLKQPTVTVSDWKLSRRKIAQAVAEIEDAPGSVFNRAYKGYELVELKVYGSEFVSGIYVRAVMIKRRC